MILVNVSGNFDSLGAHSFFDLDQAGLSDTVEIEDSLVTISQSFENISGFFETDFCPCLDTGSAKFQISNLCIIDILAFFAGFLLDRKSVV